MTDSAWVGYVGLMSGVIGTVIACLALVRTGQIKSLDLRIELSKAEVEIQALINDLPGFLERTKQSRERITAKTGQTGAFQRWLAEWNVDYETVSSLSAWLPAHALQQKKLTHEQLEVRLISAVKLLTQAKLLKEKYAASLVADDKEREQIRADIHSSTHTKLQVTHGTTNNRFSS